MEPGQIMITDAGQMTEYSTGYGGKQPTLEGAKEGADGGFAIILLL